MKKAAQILRLFLPFAFCFFLGNRIANAIRICGLNINMILADLSKNISSISFNPVDLIAGVCVGGLMLLYLDAKRKNRKNMRDKEEYGSARFAKPKEIIPYIDRKFKNNIILTKTERLRMTRPKLVTHDRNKNVLIVGGSGTGKTRFFMKPNIGQADPDPEKSKISFVITDPKGTLLEECGRFLLRCKYRLKILNLKDSYSMRKLSMKYNPFVYLKTEFDIKTFVDTLIANTSGSNPEKEDFWIKSERLLYMALVSYIVYECPKEERNFYTLTCMIRACETREDDETYKNEIDLIFEELEENGSWIIKDDQPVFVEGKDHFAVLQYKGFKLAAGKTAKSILISCMARLAPFDIQEVRELTSTDELSIDAIGDRKTAFFLILSDSNKTMNFLAAILYTQMFNQLMNKADIKYHGRLPYHVRFLLDEFANIGQIPDFETLIATIRSREISVCPVLQSIAQLKKIYDKNTGTIVGNCDSFLFLGGTEEETLKSLNVGLGKQTIDTRTTGESSGQNKSHSMNYQRTGRELMTIDELKVMDNSECILQIRGVRPFKSKKYPLEKHPSYRYYSDFNKKNLLNVEDYMKNWREQKEQAVAKQFAEIKNMEPDNASFNPEMPLEEALEETTDMFIFGDIQEEEANPQAAG